MFDKVNEGDFVLVKMDSYKGLKKEFVAQVLEVDKEEIEVRMAYLKAVSGQTYIWPCEPDEGWQSGNCILRVLKTPSLTNSMGHLCFSDIKNNIFEKYCLKVLSVFREYF
jgi:hypothetical protein